MYPHPVGSLIFQNNYTNLLSELLPIATKSTKEIIGKGDLNVKYFDKYNHLYPIYIVQTDNKQHELIDFSLVPK